MTSAIVFGVGVFLGLWVSSQRRLSLSQDYEATPPMAGCTEHTWFKALRKVPGTAVSEALALEKWARRDDIEAVLLSHKAPKPPPKRRRKVNVTTPNFHDDCTETSVAVVPKKGCVVLTQTNSKALPWHVLRYRRSGDRWQLTPRVDREMPTTDATQAAHRRISLLLNKFAILKHRLTPTLEQIAVKHWNQKSPEEEMAASESDEKKPTDEKKPQKKRRFAKKRVQSEGMILLTTMANDMDVAAGINWLCTLRRITKQKWDPLAVVTDAALKTKVTTGGFNHVLWHPAFSSQGQWLPFAAMYTCHGLGYDVLYQAPYAVWRGDLLQDILHAHKRPRGTLDVLAATNDDDGSYLPEVLFLQCNWRVEMLLDWLLFAQDLIESWGFAVVLNQYLGEAASLLGLVVERFDPINAVALIPEKTATTKATVVALDESFGRSPESESSFLHFPESLPPPCRGPDDSGLADCLASNCVPKAS